MNPVPHHDPALREAIFHHALDAIVLTDDTGRYVDANPAACAMLGYSRDELLQLHIRDVTAGTQLGQLDEIWQTFRQTGTSTGAYLFRRKDGQPILVEYRAVAHIMPGLHMAVIRDVSVRKRAEDELHRQTEILQKIFDQIPVMINFVDEQGVIRLVNREWERILGWTLEEIQARRLDIFAECYPDPQYRQTVYDFLADPKVHWADFRTRVRDGRVIDTNWAVVHLTDGTSIGIGQDISARKTAGERQSQLVHELQQANERLQYLARRRLAVQEEERQRISRELHDEAGQALTAMKILLQGVEEDLPAPLAEARRQLTNVIALADATMDGIRRLAQDLRPAALQVLSLNQALEGLCLDFHQRTGLPVEFAGAEFAPQPNEVNVCLYRVLQEALTNVTKHAAASRVWVELQEQNNGLMLAVADDGKGLPGVPSGGSGLGLVGMQERLELLRGQLRFEPRVPRGMQLVAWIPLTAPTVSPVV